MATLADVPTGLLVGQFIFVNSDSADEGTDPDAVLVNGHVMFTCSAKPPLRVIDAGLGVVPINFKAQFNQDGYLMPFTNPQRSVGIPGALEHGLLLPAGDSPRYTPTGFTWKVSWHITDAATGQRIQIPDTHIFIREGQTTDLVKEMPVTESNGVLITKGDKGDTGATFSNVRVEGDQLIATLEDGTELPPTPYSVPTTPLFGLDDAGNPYYDPNGVDNPIALMTDADGVPYFA
jgi:hypothetical protein